MTILSFPYEVFLWIYAIQTYNWSYSDSILLYFSCSNVVSFMVMLSSSELMSFSNFVIKYCTIVWRFTECNRCWSMRSMDTKVFDSNICFLQLMLSWTAFTNSYVTKFFPSSSNLGRQTFLINSRATFWVLEHISISLVTYLCALFPICR